METLVSVTYVDNEHEQMECIMAQAVKFVNNYDHEQESRTPNSKPADYQTSTLFILVVRFSCGPLCICPCVCVDR